MSVVDQGPTRVYVAVCYGLVVGEPGFSREDAIRLARRNLPGTEWFEACSHGLEIAEVVDEMLMFQILGGRDVGPVYVVDGRLELDELDA